MNSQKLQKMHKHLTQASWMMNKRNVCGMSCLANAFRSNTIPFNYHQQRLFTIRPYASHKPKKVPIKFTKQPVVTVEKDDRLRIAIIGRPNTGKSTLFNALTGRYHAIVDKVAGVTRPHERGSS